MPYSPQKLKVINKKAKYFLKKLDKSAATDYINREFRDQVWNKSGGYDDLLKKLSGVTTSTSGRALRGESISSPSSGGGYSGGGGSSSGY